MSLNPIQLEILWNRILSVANEQQTALVRTAFSTIVRESLDLACGVFDTRGQMIAQSLTGTPGHINPMATGAIHLLKAYPADSLEPGDVLVTNDPWKTEGIVHNNTIRVSAKKTYVVNAPWADWIGVVGRMQDQTVIFLVEKNTQGLQIDEPLETMGYEAAAIAGIQLESCSVPADRIILLPDSAAALASLQRWENQILMGAGLGMMKAAFTSAKDFANTHQTGGKPIIAYQEVAFKLAEMLTLYQTSQLLAYRAAWTADNQPHEKAGLTLCAKVFCAESAEKVASMALQVLSGQGYLRGSRAADAYACAKYTQIAGTSMEIARVMIGDESLGYR